MGAGFPRDKCEEFDNALPGATSRRGTGSAQTAWASGQRLRNLHPTFRGMIGLYL
jgi:hypothetical protein